MHTPRLRKQTLGVKLPAWAALWLLSLCSTALPAGDKPATTPADSSNAATQPVPDFETEIQPILAARGCSIGACHGKQGGKNGFQLSLLGFDNDFDFASLRHQARGRRLSLNSPQQSLLLQKATAALPHGGGQRLTPDDAHYETLLRWIAAGAPRRGSNPVQLQRITLEPAELIMAANTAQSLTVTATFSDGSQRDVTGLTAFSSNEQAVADVDATGQVTAGPIAGEAAVMARFMGQIATCAVLLPRQEAVSTETYQQLPVYNPIDRLVWNKLARLNLLPSPVTNDQRFLRRVYLDLIGRQPTPSAVEEFLADSSEDKYSRVIDDLLQHPGYADHWANKWVDLLRPNPYRVGIKAVMSFDNWIRQAFRENRPYDQFVRELITAEGSTWHNGASTLFRDRRSPEELTTMVSQLFLGVRLECAKCHHHPFEVWGQDDFYQFAAFFARVGRKGVGLSPPISGGEEIMFTTTSGEVKHPRDNQTMLPQALDGPVLQADAHRRQALAEWMTSDENPYFARVIANRVWAELMGVGIVQPVDDLRATNPPSNPALLDALADHLRQHDFDLKELLRWITNSYVYRLSSQPNDTNAGDYRNYSRRYRQRLRAEVLLDAINTITDSAESFDAMPAKSRANQIWSARVPSLFLDTFSRPDLNQDPPCERVTDTAVVQALHLMNSPKLHQKITRDDGLAAKLAATDQSPDQLARQLYLRVYCRVPSDAELEMCRQHFGQPKAASDGNCKEDKSADGDKPGKGRRQATEELLWALLNSAEFVFKD